ncbi:FBP domain-containing protein [Streptomyces sp. A7024]|uniref:FBP domain-containing protein n=1 Tax=Streptomyces coryli TaxID=1128680 RepID=A0A6G4UCC6_9ACTN|nr:FBP domain-containing protein [Streptomyces coryli]NGN69824.1 FBP domain-containing protein [Streptomyces coryli]
MEPLTEAQIRSSFINCTKGEAKRLNLPDLAAQPWDDLDFLGWRDPRAPDRSYLVTEELGVAFRFPSKQRGFLHRSMCSLCFTTHPGNGVSLLVARKGRAGDSVGLHMCTDLACSLYVRGIKQPAPGGRFEESLSVEQQAERMMTKLGEFVAKLR